MKKYLIYTSFILLFSCKKKYEFDIIYNVNVEAINPVLPIKYNIIYAVKDNAKSQITISSNNWSYNFAGKGDDNAYLNVEGVENISKIEIEIIVNGNSTKANCNQNNCSVELIKRL